MSGTDRIRAGVIGVGGMAKGMHLPSLGEIDGVEIVALCDIVEERAVAQAEVYKTARTYTHYQQMLAKEELDAVHVLVEPANLFHVTRRCLEAGLHTFMEKPPGVSSFQARSLARHAETAGKVLQVGFNRRHIPVVQHVVARMRELTQVNQVVGRFMKMGTSIFDGGSMSSFACDTIHAVDLVRWMAGGVPEKAATVAGQYDGEAELNAWNAVVRFDNGVTGVLMANYKAGSRLHDFELHGPGASAFINLGFGGKECEARILIAKGKAGYSITATGAGGHGLETIDGIEVAGSDDFRVYYGHRQQNKHFIDCIRSGRQPDTSIQDAVKTFEMIDLLNRSII